MSERIEALTWDSEFFELAIGQVDLQDADQDRIADIVIEARDREFDCVYGSHVPGTSYTSAHAQQAGFALVEINQLMRRPPGPFENRPTNSTLRVATEDDLDQIGDSLDRLAPWSRFGADPRFGKEAARRLHSAWVRRAVVDDTRMATISEDENGIDGVGSLVWDEAPRIDLLAVLRPGTGAAQLHLAKLVEWANDGETLGGPCAARNLAPLRFLEHGGYALSHVTYTHHWWAT